MSTAEHLLELLRRHYIRNEDSPTGVFAAEIGAPEEDRRADLIWMGLTRASGRQLIGHEIKVTRQDLRAELADPSKAEAWQQYCDRWYLVVPHVALISGFDLPPEWGVLTPPAGRRRRSMTVEREAAELHPANQAPGMRTVAAWLFWRHRRSELENERLKASEDGRPDFGGAA